MNKVNVVTENGLAKWVVTPKPLTGAQLKKLQACRTAEALRWVENRVLEEQCGVNDLGEPLEVAPAPKPAPKPVAPAPKPAPKPVAPAPKPAAKPAPKPAPKAGK